MGVTINPGVVESFLLKRLWEVGRALGAVWATTTAHLASVRGLEMAMPRFAKSGVATEEHWSGSSGL